VQEQHRNHHAKPNQVDKYHNKQRYKSAVYAHESPMFGLLLLVRLSQKTEILPKVPQGRIEPTDYK
jgi:hypothetical protein